MTLRQYTGLAAALVFVGLWQLVCATGVVSDLLLASPGRISAWLIGAVTRADFWSDIGATLRRVCVAFGLSAFIGIPLGLLIGRSKWLVDLFEFPIDFGRSIPATVLFPLFLILFGVGESSRIACAVYGATLIIAVNTMSGVRQANPIRVQAGRLHGARGWRMLVYVLLPEVAPSILTGCRVGVSLSFVIIVLVEMLIGTRMGLGHRMIEAEIVYEIPELYGLIFVTGVLGYALNYVFTRFEHRVCHYVGKG